MECGFTPDTIQGGLIGEYRPTTEQIEDAYAHDPEAEWHDPINYGLEVKANRRVFRRWLADHDAGVAAKALRDAATEWDEWYSADIFSALNAADHERVTAAIRDHTGVSRDAVSADVFRHASAQLRARAAAIADSPAPEQRDNNE
jgi:hypothetical protein